MKEQKLTLPENYAVIGSEEMVYIEGGLGAENLNEGNYHIFETAGRLTDVLEGLITRIAKPSYEVRDAVNKGFAGIGILQTVINVINPTALANAINIAPALTGIVNALGNLGLDRL